MLHRQPVPVEGGLAHVQRDRSRLRDAARRALGDKGAQLSVWRRPQFVFGLRFAATLAAPTIATATVAPAAVAPAGATYSAKPARRSAIAPTITTDVSAPTAVPAARRPSTPVAAQPAAAHAATATVASALGSCACKAAVPTTQQSTAA